MAGIKKHQAVLLPLLVFMLAAVLLTGCGKNRKAPADALAVNGEELHKIEQFNSAAEGFYQSALSGNNREARLQLEEISVQITKIDFHGVTGVEGMKAVSETIVNAKRVYNAAASIPQEQAIAAATRLRLAADAMTHLHEPMWHQYGPSIRGRITQLETALYHKNGEEAGKALSQLRDQYFLIRPALLISQTPSDVERADSLFTFLGDQLSRPDKGFAAMASAANQLEESFAHLFGNKDDKTAYLPLLPPDRPVLWTIGVAAVILSVLAAVAWRMFHSEKSVIRFPIGKSTPGRDER